MQNLRARLLQHGQEAPIPGTVQLPQSHRQLPRNQSFASSPLQSSSGSGSWQYVEELERQLDDIRDTLASSSQAASDTETPVRSPLPHFGSDFCCCETVDDNASRQCCAPPPKSLPLLASSSATHHTDLQLSWWLDCSLAGPCFGACSRPCLLQETNPSTSPAMEALAHMPRTVSRSLLAAPSSSHRSTPQAESGPRGWPASSSGGSASRQLTARVTTG